MNNLIAIVSCGDKKRKELIRGFLASKGFRPYSEHDLRCPIMLVLEEGGKFNKTLETLRKKAPKSRIVLLNGDDRIPYGGTSADSIYQIDAENAAFFMQLEGFIGREKEKTRGVKSIPPITVPGQS